MKSTDFSCYQTLFNISSKPYLIYGRMIYAAYLWTSKLRVLMDSIIKKIGLIFGISGALFISLTYIYIWQQQDYLNGIFTVIVLLVPLILAFGAQIVSKVKLNGYISLKQGVTAFVICIGLIFLVDGITSYLIYVHIDPGAQDLIAQAQEARRQELIEQGIQTADYVEVDYSFKGYAIATATKFLMYTAVGMLMALILRKKRPIAQ
ncbi:hypothetical protein BST97_01050 [Nonlabens spongiae]|uniref:DUF4199 domain-containing protein n=1 Tax=Nonlabens spongiae TaxID=331648 RepID=A0A1W6MGJ9_9FLAO|nr:DUF4199 family protein [Nonlabens spongiae]ARN76702.1 hypothetical protein BST97_01050 [Nonlabens spongiae]